MIVVCPNCRASYLVPATVFSAGPRTVRCARCGHEWLGDKNAAAIFNPPPPPPPPAGATLPPLTEAPPPPPASPPTPSSPPAAAKLPVVWENPFKAKMKWIALGTGGVLILALLAGLLLGHSLVVKYVPSLMPLYHALGLEGGLQPQHEALNLLRVSSERRYENGSMQLVVEGDVVNEGGKPFLLPALLAEAIGSDGKIIQSWKIDPPAPRLEKGKALAFRSAIPAPAQTVVAVNLRFAEAPHASQEP